MKKMIGINTRLTSVKRFNSLKKKRQMKSGLNRMKFTKQMNDPISIKEIDFVFSKEGK